MDLQSNPTLLTSYFIIFQIRHQFTIQPRLDMISLHTDSHRIPFAHIDVIFSFRLMEPSPAIGFIDRSEEHTSELQSRGHLVCRLLLEKKKNKNKTQESQTKHTDEGTSNQQQLCPRSK